MRLQEIPDFLCPALVVLGLFFGVWAIVRAIARRSRARSAEVIAGNFGGELHKRSQACPNAHISFEHNSARVVLELGHGRQWFVGRRPLRLRVAWPDPDMWCEIRPRVVSRRLDKLRGGRRVSSGELDFDRLYITRGAPTEKIELLLSAAVRICIDQLRFLYDTNNVEVRIAAGELIVSKRSLSRHPTTIIRFGQLALELYDQALLLQSAGLTFLPGETSSAKATVLSGNANCRVCGEKFAGKIVVCLACRTPHHRDCWKYFGGCATYGCGGRKFKRGSAAANEL